MGDLRSNRSSDFLRLSRAPLVTMDPNGSVPAIWQEARNAEGRAYYYNVQTKATQWTKPQELMTPVEVRTEIL